MTATTPTSAAPLLRLTDLSAGYRGTPLYEGVSATVEAGELVALLGANGAGKSTLLRCITGRLIPMAGRVEICGRSLDAISHRELARMVSVVTTADTHAGALTVEELVALGRQPHTGFFGRLSTSDRAIVAEAIEAVGLATLTQRLTASLSDGERQKAMIARALAQQTPLMVLDEPTAFLDVASRLETMQLLGRLARERGKAILLSTHDVASALRLASSLWLITPDGCQSGRRRLTTGPTDTLIANGLLDSLFAGRDVRFDPSALDFLPAAD